MTTHQTPATAGDLSASFERTNPNIFHIHIDAKQITPDTQKAFIDLGFFAADFTGHPEGFRHFEPNLHMTFVTADRASFNLSGRKASPSPMKEISLAIWKASSFRTMI